MNLLYPKLSVRSFLYMLGATLFGVLVAGIYGALHDQISYSISPEYFKKMKFQQFAHANFGWPPRVFAAEVGFLASWWVGMIAGWIIGRIGYGFLPIERATKRVLNAFAILIGTAIICGIIGVLLGYFQTQGSGIDDWQDWREELKLEHTREFAIVAYLHGWSYLGAIFGLIAAIVYLILNRK